MQLVACFAFIIGMVVLVVSMAYVKVPDYTVVILVMMIIGLTAIYTAVSTIIFMVQEFGFALAPLCKY